MAWYTGVGAGVASQCAIAHGNGVLQGVTEIENKAFWKALAKQAPDTTRTPPFARLWASREICFQSLIIYFHLI